MNLAAHIDHRLLGRAVPTAMRKDQTTSVFAKLIRQLAADRRASSRLPQRNGAANANGLNTYNATPPVVQSVALCKPPDVTICVAKAYRSRYATGVTAEILPAPAAIILDLHLVWSAHFGAMLIDGV
jgi:hypothetical protein